jgi:hypothetical protein
VFQNELLGEKLVCILYTQLQKNKRPFLPAAFLKQLPGSYFGGVVVSVVCFFDFFPPLWDLLVLVAFLPLVLVVVGLVVLWSPVLPVPV